jgi:hypothetical protein
MIIPSVVTARRDAWIAKAFAEEARGEDDLARRAWAAADVYESALPAAHSEYDALLASLLDDFSEIPSAVIREAGYVIEVCREMRVVGLTCQQAWRQYGRIKEAMLDHGIPAEPLEFVAKRVAVAMSTRSGGACPNPSIEGGSPRSIVSVPTDRVR